jgi:hypothetical protein
VKSLFCFNIITSVLDRTDLLDYVVGNLDVARLIYMVYDIVDSNIVKLVLLKSKSSSVQ